MFDLLGERISVYFLRIDSPKMADRIKTGLRKVVKLLCTRLVTFNMFPPRNFGSRLDQNKAKRLGQWTTRLYIVLLVASVVIWALRSAIEPRILTKSYTNPTFDEYRRLSRTHGDALQCPCSSISLKYEQFVRINPVFHQVRTHNNPCRGMRDSYPSVSCAFTQCERSVTLLQLER